MEGGGGKVTGTNREVEAVVAASFAARTAASIDFRQHGRAPWCALTVSGQGGAFGSLAGPAIRAGARGGRRGGTSAGGDAA